MLKKIKILAKKLNLQGNSTYFVYVITLWMKFGANQNCNYFSTHIHGKEPYLIMKKLAILKIILFISIIGLIIFSLLAITLSSNIVVDNAVLLASQIGISQKIISMTVIVIGTSLPELTMTINAARKDEFDMAVGNIIGTNIFNICIVLGLPIAIYGGVSSSSFNVVDTSVVLLSALMFYIFGRSNKELSRREGLLMVLVFILYYTYVFIS